MDIDLNLLSQLALPHVIIMGAITFLAANQPGKFTVPEIVALVVGWLMPIIGPISAGIFVLISRNRRSKSGGSG